MQARGPVIETARIRRGIKRRALAEQLGLSYQHIYGLERGWNGAAEETLQRIADALGLNLDQVVYRRTAADPSSTLESDDDTGAAPPGTASSTEQSAEQTQHRVVA